MCFTQHALHVASLVWPLLSPFAHLQGPSKWRQQRPTKGQHMQGILDEKDPENWSKQVKSVAKSFKAKLSELKRMKFLQRQVLEEICFQSVIAGVVYCVSVWGIGATVQLNEIETTNKKAAKLIYDVKRDEDPLRRS